VLFGLGFGAVAWSQEGVYLRAQMGLDLNHQDRRTESSSKGVSQQSLNYVELKPSLRLSYQSHPLNLNLSYAPKVIKLSGDTDWQVVQQLDLTSKLSLIDKDRAAVALRASVRELNTNSVLGLTDATANQVLPTDDRVRYSSLELAPHWKLDLPGDTHLNLQASAQLQETQSILVNRNDANALRNAASDDTTHFYKLTALWESAAHQEVGWQLKLDSQLNKTKVYDEERNNAQGMLRWVVDDHFRVYALGGWQYLRRREHYDQFSESSTSGLSYGLGFDYFLSRRSQIGGRLERTPYGVTYNLDARLGSAFTLQNLNLSRSVSNPRQLFTFPGSEQSTASVLNRYLSTRISDANDRQAEVDRLINTLQLPSQISQTTPYNINREVLQTMRAYSFVYSKKRLSLGFSLSDVLIEPVRDNFDSFLGLSSQYSRTQNASLRLSYQLSTTLGQSMAYVRSRGKYAQASTNQLTSQAPVPFGPWQYAWQFDWSMRQQLGKNLNLNLSFVRRHDQVIDSLSTAVGNSTHRIDNRLILGMVYQF
jgi:hypothetical protein